MKEVGSVSLSMTSDELCEGVPFHGPRFHVFRSLRRTMIVSMAALTAWLAGSLLFFGFWASRFSLVQDIVLGVVSVLVLGAVLFGSWIAFGLRFVDP